MAEESNPPKIIDLRPRPRYVMDHNAVALHVPVPTQICFWLGNVYDDGYITKDAIKLVEIEKIKRAVNADVAKWDIVYVGFTILDPDNGHPTGTRKVFTCNVPTHKWRPMGPPSFVPAIDRWATVPDARQAYADVLDVFEHGFGLINAQHLDLKQEMARLNATLARLVPTAQSCAPPALDPAN